MRLFIAILVLITAILITPGCGPDDAWTDDAYFKSLYVWDGTSWNQITKNGDVTAAANLDDHSLVRGDGGSKGVQDSNVTVDDAGNIDTHGGDISVTTIQAAGDLNTDMDVNAGNDVNVTNNLDVGDDADVGGDLGVDGSADVAWSIAAGDSDLLTLYQTTTDGTPTKMLYAGLTGTGLTVKANSAVSFDLKVVARDNTTGDCAGYTVSNGLIKRDGAGNTVLSSGTVAVDYEDDATWDCNIAADDAAEKLAITVTGDAANTTQWSAVLIRVETVF